MFELDLKSRKSIYEQVVDKFKEEILLGIIGPDEKLPSVREMSKELTVNPNTIQKSFRELERQGYIYTVSGVGSFATAKSEIIPDEKVLDEVRSRIFDDIRELYYLLGDDASARLIVEDILKNVEAKLRGLK
jgi:GntR family transcriptional regulator